MSSTCSNDFPSMTDIFREHRLPDKGIPVGYAALVERFSLVVPLPKTLSAIGIRHKVYEKDGWSYYTPRHQPESSVMGHTVFALKYEGVDLLILKKLFEVIDPEEITSFVYHKPTSSYARRIWFLYEWLLNIKLDISDAKSGSYVKVIDERLQYGIKGELSQRHRVHNNLLGTRDFCPLIYKTQKIESYLSKCLHKDVIEVMGSISDNILMRTTAFLLMKDSKSSYLIEGETPPQTRIQRWGRAIVEAGKNPLTLDELLRLQRIVIGESRFIELGLRKEGGFVGIHDQDTRMPVPDHISARPEDLPTLVEGLINTGERISKELDPVMQAAVLSFGFVYIHPFVDGNGRIHRYLMHHALASKGFSPEGFVFPISATILEHINDYRKVLETHSKKILTFIEWLPTSTMNVNVLNDTVDFYKYFDATGAVEFLYSCVEKTIKINLPREIQFLKNYDHFKTRIDAFMDMPDSLVDLLYKFLNQSDGRFSKRALEKEFRGLKNNEVHYIEKIYRETMVNI